MSLEDLLEHRRFTDFTAHASRARAGPIPQPALPAVETGKASTEKGSDGVGRRRLLAVVAVLDVACKVVRDAAGDHAGAGGAMVFDAVAPPPPALGATGVVMRRAAIS